MNKIYTGIGSRDTPHEIRNLMTELAQRLEGHGFILRSGAADGADQAFEKGVTNPDNKEIYLPWKGFNGSTSELYTLSNQALATVNNYHPAPDYLNNVSIKLMARNSYQVLGQTLDKPSSFVLCWTPDGCEDNRSRKSITGGTGQAVSIASFKKIAIFNLKNLESLAKLKQHLKQNFDCTL